LGDHAADEISSVDPVVAKGGSGKAKIAGSGFGAAGTDSGSHPVTGTDSSSHAATGTDSGGHVAEMDDLRGSGRDHPARYAMAELVNIHSEAIKFEPIHRALFNVAPDEALDALSSYFAHRGYSIRIEPQAAGEPDEPGALQAGCMQDVLRGGGKLDELDAPQAGCGQDAPHGKRGASVPQAAGEPDKQGDPQGAGGGFDLPMMWPGHRAVAHVASPASALPVAELQAFLDSFCESRPGAALDYIHGEDELSRLVEDEACFAFLLPPIDKAAFFDTIIRDGQFPRKAFSMGEARDKRYYLEARMIQPQL
jgi:hypothetical protein